MHVRSFYREQLTKVLHQRDSLPQTSHVKAAASNDLLDSVRDLIEATDPASELDLRGVPYVYTFLSMKTVADIADLDGDIDLVMCNSRSDRTPSVARFLSARRTDHISNWYGGIFEVFAKSRMLRCFRGLEFDVKQSNGRDHDIAGLVKNRRLHFECTVLTEDDETREVWDRFLKANLDKPNRCLVRPGPYDPPDAKSTSVYYMPLRLYGKVFDKITKHLDPSGSQFGRDEPNILLVCFAGPNVEEPGVGWALDELFSELPKMSRTGVPEGFTDISLQAWAEFTANELVQTGKRTSEWYCENSNHILCAPKQIGGAMLFDGSELRHARLNYNADEACLVTHQEIAELEIALSQRPSYWI